MIVGDGIREGVGAITEFLEGHASTLRPFSFPVDPGGYSRRLTAQGGLRLGAWTSYSAQAGTF
jgi:hypothetical protein